MLTNEQLDEIITTKREELGSLNSRDLALYFETCQGTEQPSWKFMDKKRMRDLFSRFQKCHWCSPERHEQIKDALSQLK